MSTQRMQLNAAMKDFPGRPDSFSTEEEHSYKSSKIEEQWKWDRDAPNVSNQISPHSFNEGLGGNGKRSYYQDQMPDQRRSSDNRADTEPRSLSQEQDMEVGYEDNPSPLTFEGLERKFINEIMNLAKEQSHTEDVEYARHREKIMEINTRHQEKVSALRAKQATAREEFLHKELQARLNRYQQPGTTNYRNPGLHDAHGYFGASVAVAEAHRDFATSQFESYRELPSVLRREKTQGTEIRVPYPSGRVYNNAARNY